MQIRNILGFLCVVGLAAAVEGAEPSSLSPREPLMQTPLAALPLGAIRPEGWLRDQLIVQATGITGHLDEFWPTVSDSAWKGGEGDGWERGPYYLDGLVPLAYLLDDARLKDKVQGWMDWMLESGQPNGWFGPRRNTDRWPLAVAMKVLTQYHEATGDPRVIPLLEGHFKYLKDAPPDWPHSEWRGVRAMENVVTAWWLHARTGNPDILEVARSIHENSFGWTEYFLNFPYTAEVTAQGIQYGHPSHVVNIAMAIKHPGMWYRQSQDSRHREAVYAGMAALDEHHGQVGGRFSGDEHLSGVRPTQGTELCAVVEYMFSLEKLIEVLGDAALADRLEALAYNANPGAHTADFWAHQYDQQANQVLCSVARRAWSTNSDSANVYGLEPHYGCCTANMHQGWPKFISHMWMATADKGLAAVAYGPNRVTAQVGDGVAPAPRRRVTITQTTDYPFDGAIRLAVEAAQEVRFPLHLRVPAWAEGATVNVGDDRVAVTPGEFAVIDRTWKSGDVVELDLPMTVRTETRYNNAVAVLRGPLVFALRIGEERIALKRHHDTLPVVDWEIRPTTPWNYGLMIDRQNPSKDVKVEQRRPGRVPFETEAAPVTLRVKGRQIPGWQLEQNSAGDTPISPVQSDEPVTELELIPYGSTRLRIAEFPALSEPRP